ncbi:hypothetical protein FHR20_004395 [Sphingomonas leidyi]|uniref:Uncharacterized protein n=1 Tax=Sphingomonas leidyi TaxID=68569 RepID=A0A7X5V522_9SPHN|nr:hypothetical protein [Sphingomonas leidyi]NIJ67411.1 hypothetical protein [Sphingomonas leidyi]
MSYRIALAAAAAALLVPMGAQAQETLAPSELARDALPADADTARIEIARADLAGAIGTWSGVRNCGDAARVKGLMQAAFDRWIGQQVQARPGRLLITYGWESSSWSYRNGRRPWPSNARYCRGSFGSAKVYARFY